MTEAVLFVEDDALRSELNTLASEALGCVIVAVGTEEDLRRVLELEPPAVVIVSAANRSTTPTDVPMARRAHYTCLVIVDGLAEATPAVLVRMPADGYLERTKLSAPALADAIRRLYSGEMILPLALGRRLIQLARHSVSPESHDPLTSRETETLYLLLQGLSNKEIGLRMSITEHGAKRLVGSLLLKLDAGNRTAAVAKAIRLGLVQPVLFAP